jgi:hypothetical protein
VGCCDSQHILQGLSCASVDRKVNVIVMISLLYIESSACVCVNYLLHGACCLCKVCDSSLEHQFS